MDKPANNGWNGKYADEHEDGSWKAAMLPHGILLDVDARSSHRRVAWSATKPPEKNGISPCYRYFLNAFPALMIPISTFRILLLLLIVSGALVLADGALANLGVRGHVANVASGVFAGAVVFFLAYEWGRVLRFCGKGIIRSEKLERNVAAILQSIGIKSQHLEISIIDSKDFHGATVREGGGHRMFLSTRLLDVLSPAALRGVIAHEYGHVENAHPIKLAALLGIIASVKLSVGVPLGAVMVILFAYLFMLREWEYVADASAVQRVGHDDVLAAFREYRAASGEKDMSRLSEFFCGHPSIRRRMAAIIKCSASSAR